MLPGLLLLTLIAQSRSTDLPRPPFTRIWTAQVGEQAGILGVREGALLFSSAAGLGALDLKTGAYRWKVAKPHGFNDARLAGNEIVISNNSERTGELSTIQLSDRKQRKIYTAKAPVVGYGVASNRIYIVEEPRIAKCLDLRTGAVLWSVPLRPGNRERSGSCRIVCLPKGVYIGIDGDAEYGLDPATGRIRWRHKSEYAGLYPPLLINSPTDLITKEDGLTRLNTVTGKPVWNIKYGDSSSALLQDVMIGMGNKKLEAHLVSTGAPVWSIPLKDAGTSYGSEPYASSTQAWMPREPFLCLNRDGKLLWEDPHPFTGIVVYADASEVVTIDQFRILGYQHGALPPLPTTAEARRSAAERLVSHYEDLDEAERNQIPGLAPYAFPLLLKKYTGWAQEWARDHGDGYQLYVLLTDAPNVMLEAFRKEDSDQIVSVLTALGPKSEWRGSLERILQERGDPQSYIPTLVKTLRNAPKQGRAMAQTLDTVSRSNHPEAVKFMIDALANPKAPSDWRRAAFIHLAGTGGSAGQAAVLNAKHKLAPMKPWWDRIDLAETKSGRTNLGIKADSRGHKWMLFTSGVLGNYSDLFVVEVTATGFSRPIFTGTYVGRTFKGEAPKAFRGIPMARLLASEWIKIFPTDPEIRRDSDGDGLTDLVEARLGTDPHRADTDGDCIGDATDPCPNGFGLAITDEQKIVCAAVEARFFEGHWECPVVLDAAGVKPCKVMGPWGPVLWQQPGKTDQLDKVYGGGVNFITFQSPKENSPNGSIIEYSADHKKAKTFIRRVSGGLNGDGQEVDLIKVGDDWFVVDLNMKWIS